MVKNSSTALSDATRPKSARVFLEQLESRIAPAALVGIAYKDITLGSPQIVTAGQGIKANGAYILAVTQGQAIVYTTDLNGNNQFDPNEITGIAAGNGLKMTSFVDINGDIVTNLKSDGTLSDSSGNGTGHDGLLLLNSKITAITLRSLTAADTASGQAANDSYINHLIPSTYSIHGNIYAGGGIGDGVVGDGIVIDTAGTNDQITKFNGNHQYYQVAGIAPSLGAVKTGSAAGGQVFSFGYYPTTSTVYNPSAPITADNHAAGNLQYGGLLKPYTPGIGTAGSDINGLSVGSGASNDTTTTPSSPVPFTIDSLVAGNGGIGAKGGSIANINLDGDSGGLRIQAGDGGSGPTGGAGGSIGNLADFGSVEGDVLIKTGNGGEGFLGAAGAAGALSLGQFSMNGHVHFDLGNGGDALGNAGAGSSLTSGTLTPTGAGGSATAVSVITTWREAGDIGSPRLIDFNGDGYSDVLFVTTNPDQIGIRFGGQNGISNSSPVLYFASPSFATLDTSTSGIVVGDFNGDGLPDIAVASSVANSTDGIHVFLNPGGSDGNGAFGSGNGWSAAASSDSVALGGNYIDSSIHVALPTLNTVGYLNSGGAVTHLVAGDFNQDGHMDLAYSTQVYYINNGGIASSTPIVLLSGTGDGRFFPDFGYDNTTGQSTTMPVLDYGSFKLAAPKQLLATAAVSGDTSSDLMISAGNGVNILQYSGGVMSTTASMAPQYDTATIVANNGVNTISGWVATKAPPAAIAVGSIDGTTFDVISVEAGSAITLMAGQYDSGTGLASFASYKSTGTETTPHSGGVILTGADQGQKAPNPDINTLLLTKDGAVYNIVGIASGDFGGPTANAIQFSLYSAGDSTPVPGSTPVTGKNEFFQFYLTGYNLHGADTYLPAGSLNNTNGDLNKNGAFKGAPVLSGYDANINAFGTFNKNVTDDITSTPVGYVAASPSSNCNGFRGDSSSLFVGLGSTGTSVGFGLNDYRFDLTAGSGGNSHVGAGGAGGSIGTGTITTSLFGTVTASVSIMLPSAIFNQPFVYLTGGAGGSGFTSGGAGGSLQGLILNYVSGTTALGSFFDLQAADGGSGFFGAGGNGGSLSNFQAQTAANFAGGNGGFGYQGGTGGGIDGTAGASGYSVYQNYIFLTAGTGGDGIVSGGNGGSIVGFATLFPGFTSGVGGELNYQAGNGGNAIAGTGGAGGAIQNASPISTNNNLAGAILLHAGLGGDGLSGGAGGSVTNFSNQSTANTAVTVVSIDAGNGGTGVTGNGGAGGGISTIYASGQGVDNAAYDQVTNTYISYQYNRIVAGDGGTSYGAIGGAGGGLSGITSTAQSSAEALAAGSGGDGMTKGGNGGSVVSVTGDSANNSTSKVLVFAGVGGNAFAALSTAPGVASSGDTSAAIVNLRAFGNVNGIGGNGGGISNFTQPKSTQAAVDLIAGNGGSVMNYGNPANTSGAGYGGSMANIYLAGTAGRIDQTVAIQSYATGFVQNILRDSPSTALTDSGATGGNVGVIVGAAGMVNGGLPSLDAVTKTGFVSTFSASSIMSMVAGSVDRIAAINTISGISSTGLYGAYKTNPVGPQVAAPNQRQHDSTHSLYFAADGVTEVSTPVAGSKLMDGVIAFLNNPGNIPGPRVWKL